MHYIATINNVSITLLNMDAINGKYEPRNLNTFVILYLNPIYIDTCNTQRT